MGVNQLWQILEPIRQRVGLETLRGRRLAIDLSCWICEAQNAKGMAHTVTSPYLRNLFFRIHALKRLGVKLVFVVESSTVCELKWETVRRRVEERRPAAFNGRRAVAEIRKPPPVRRQLKHKMEKCVQMLDLLGIPYVRATGEAEATCATLNLANLVDGCVTEDSDTFLYGAPVVYRGLSTNEKDPRVDIYTLRDVEKRLGMSRSSLIALAFLLGCDYCPKGVPGVGREKALKWLMELGSTTSPLERFRAWNKGDDRCVSSTESFIRRKALALDAFPDSRIMDEFLSSVEAHRTFVVPPCQRPNVERSLDFIEAHLGWPHSYTQQKVFELLTYFTMTTTQRGAASDLVPERILKSRIVKGVAVFEVEWRGREAVKIGDENATKDAYLVTIENAALVERVYPNIVDDFRRVSTSKKKNATRSKKCDQRPRVETATARVVPETIVVVSDSDEEEGESLIVLSDSEDDGSRARESHVDPLPDIGNLSMRDSQKKRDETSGSPLPLRERLRRQKCLDDSHLGKFYNL